MFSQGFDKEKLDSYFYKLEENNKFMGSVAVAQNGTIIYSKSVGCADCEKNIKADENSKYRIGSISKTFTAVLVLKAIENKKLKLNQTIDKYFPAIKNANYITIEHLMHHRSGIHNITNNKDYLSWSTQPKTEEDIVEIIIKAGSDFSPDSKAEYSNSNYILLTYILEKTFNKSYSELLKIHISKPNGLSNTYFGGKINTSKNECKSYRFTNKWSLMPETDTSVPLGAGGIVSTPSDLTKFSNALFGGKLFKLESLKMMKTIKNQYGMGLIQLPFHNKIGYGHTGGIDGFSSIFSYFNDGNISYALTSNGTNYNNNNLSIAVLSAIYNKSYDVSEFTSYELNSEDLDKYLGVYASKRLPLKITVTKIQSTLMAQATGQSAFPLEATKEDQFRFDQAGIVMEFNPTEATMILKQRGGQFEFKKK